jgi:hypothetical protein
MEIFNFIEKNILNSICCEINRTRSNDYNYDTLNARKLENFFSLQGQNCHSPDSKPPIHRLIKALGLVFRKAREPAMFPHALFIHPR